MNGIWSYTGGWFSVKLEVEDEGNGPKAPLLCYECAEWCRKGSIRRKTSVGSWGLGLCRILELAVSSSRGLKR